MDTSAASPAPAPSAPPPPYAAHAPDAPDAAVAREYLGARGFPPGLVELVEASARAFAGRTWIVDNSGSMSTPDGHRLLAARPGAERLVGCSRWDEVCESLAFHAGLAAALAAPTRFTFINAPRVGPQTVVVRSAEDAAALAQAAAAGPGGVTPLCAHVRAFVAELERDAPALRAAGRQVTLTIVTDGLPTDGDLAAAMAPLASLPVWVVVRLCTDEEGVIAYWAELDGALELDMDVLDDLSGEAAEVRALTPWLSYGPALHLLREWGAHHRLLDLLDERPLSRAEAAELVELVLGGGALPHPELDPAAFGAAVRQRLEAAPPTFNPLRGRSTPWVDERGLAAAMRGGVWDACAIM